MDLKNLLKKRIVEEVLNVYEGGWAILVYDAYVAQILQYIFTRTEFSDYNIAYSYHINAERTKLDLPVIYFTSHSEESISKIRKEIKDKLYSDVFVCCLANSTMKDGSITQKISKITYNKDTAINGIDSSIKQKMVNLNVVVPEERYFLCSIENLNALSKILNLNLNLNYLRSTEELARSIQKTLSKIENESASATLIILDRNIDLFTPLLHFYTFKCVLNELNIEEDEDELFKEIRYEQIENVNDILKKYVEKLNRNVELLSKKTKDTVILSKMVIDAPKNIELKENIEKYYNYLEQVYNRVKYLNEFVQYEQLLVTEYDSTGKRIKLNLNDFLKFLKNSNFSKEDTLRFLYLIKAKNIKLTAIEENLLKSMGYSMEDIKVQLNTQNQIIKEGIPAYKSTLMRYEPSVSYLINKYLVGNSPFLSFGSDPKLINSLRQTKMISCDKKQSKRCVIIYINNGVTIEEISLAYHLSDKYGIDLFIGGDKLITPKDSVEHLKKISKIQK